MFMNQELFATKPSQALCELDRSIYKLWRFYGYSDAYWKLEDARIAFEKYVNKRPGANQ